MQSTATANALADDDRLLRVPEAAKILNLSRSAVYGLLGASVLPCVRLRGTGSRCAQRVRMSDLQSYIAAGMAQDQ